MILGVLAAFFQITGTITVAPVFLWVVLGVAAVFLGILLITRSARSDGRTDCACAALTLTLVGILLYFTWSGSFGGRDYSDQRN